MGPLGFALLIGGIILVATGVILYIFVFHKMIMEKTSERKKVKGQQREEKDNITAVVVKI